MIRTQVQLTEEQARSLRELAAKRGISMAELIRRAAERIIAEAEKDERWRRADAIVGRFHSRQGDIAEEHDKYLEESYQH